MTITSHIGRPTTGALPLRTAGTKQVTVVRLVVNLKETSRPLKVDIHRGLGLRSTTSNRLGLKEENGVN